MMNDAILATGLGFLEVVMLIWSRGKWVLLGAVITYIWDQVSDVIETMKRVKKIKEIKKNERR